MKAAVLISKNNLVYKKVSDLKIKKEEVLIRVKMSGICGSDIPRVFENKAHFYPIILGHEFSGEVVKKGEKVINLEIGDRVVGIPLVPCLKCKECKKGDYAFCKNYRFVGSSIQGSFAEYIKLNEKNVLKIQKNISFEKGVFFEPATVALHALKRLNYKKGKNTY